MPIENLNDYLRRNIVTDYKKQLEINNHTINFNYSKDINKMNSNELLETEILTGNNLKKLESFIIPDIYKKEFIISKIDLWFTDNMKIFQNEIDSLEKARKIKSEQLQINLETEKEEIKSSYNKLLFEYKDKLKEVFQPIYYVQEHKQKFEEFASNYHIDLTCYTIDFLNMSLQEIREISLIANETASKILNGTKGLSSILILLYLPLYWQPFEEQEFNILLKGFYLFLMILLILSCKIWLLSIISFAIIIQAVGNLFYIKQNQKLLSIVYMLNENFEQFDNRIVKLLSEDPSLKKLENQLKALEELKVDKYLSEHLADIQVQIDLKLQKSPEIELKRQIEETNKNLKTYISDMIKYRNLYMNFYKEKLKLYKNYYHSIWEEIKLRAEKAYEPGMPVSTSYIMSFQYKSAIVESVDGTIVDYVQTELPFKNVLFLYNNEKEILERMNRIKLILSSMIGNVREYFLEIAIVDTKQLGRSMTEFLHKSIRNIVKLVTEDWEKTLKTIISIAKENMLSIGTKNFNEYNRDNSAEGKVTIEYKIIIILSTDEDLWNSKTFREFKQYSTDMGVWIWLLHGSENLYTKDNKIPDNLHELLQFPVMIQDDSCFLYNDNTYQLYETGKFIKPLQYTVEIGKNSVNSLAAAMESSRVDIINYEEEYRKRHIPNEKIWTYSTLNGIELHFGFLDGDRSNPHAEWLGSDGAKPVHCLMAGETGAGKSATINQVLANLLYMYSPEELELIMIDFKNVEFNMYTGDLLIPHAKLIAGTTDGEYALSIFQYLLTEMRHRQSEFAKYKFQNIMDWNKAVYNKEINELYMPRILLLADEFQVMVRPYWVLSFPKISIRNDKRSYRNVS